MEWKIGEIKQINGEMYQCVEGNGCKNCAFDGRKCYIYDGTDDPIGECSYDRRIDNKDVIFKKLESLETMDTKQLLKFIASKLIAIDEKLSTINSL